MFGVSAFLKKIGNYVPQNDNTAAVTSFLTGVILMTRGIISCEMPHVFYWSA